jgi:hypothetical protein
VKRFCSCIGMAIALGPPPNQCSVTGTVVERKPRQMCCYHLDLRYNTAILASKLNERRDHHQLVQPAGAVLQHPILLCILRSHRHSHL